jgi:predicted AAA+ superfamily ATPase
MNELGIKQGLILTYNQEETIANDGKEIAVVPVWRWLIEDTAPV